MTKTDPRPRREGPRVLFRVAAGPRIGSGHLIRATRLAALTGIDSVFSVRGVVSALRLPGRLARVTRLRRPADAIARERPSLVVVDDPSATHAAAWVAAARASGCPVAAFADSGIGARDGDVLVDGSVAPVRRRLNGGSFLAGPEYAVVDPAVERAARLEATRPRVFISLGGGVRTVYAARLAASLVAAWPGLRVVVAGGFVASCAPAHPDSVTWLGPQRSLVPWLAPATVAIVAGGITLYEACALGVPTVAVPVVDGQRAAVEAMAARGAVWRTAVEGARLPACPDVLPLAFELLRSGEARERLRARAQSVVDGGGATRVAHVLQQLGGLPVSNHAERSRNEAA
ncbi:MAG: hypothetical protein AB7I50_18145 [Vicinamibacterales bacterium]